MEKKPNDYVAWHHAATGKISVIRVAEGSHQIFVGVGQGEQSGITLNTGDYAIFFDHKPETNPDDGLSGHWSMSGLKGARLERWEIALEL